MFTKIDGIRAAGSYTVVAMLVLVVATGCGAAEYRDVSGENEYINIIGNKFRTKVKMFAHKITLNEEYKPSADYILVTNPPGIGGPEILEKDVVPIGSSFELVHVMKCTNCIFEDVFFRVSFDRLFKYENDEVRLSSVGGKNFLVGGAPYRLNAQFFEEVDE